MGMIDRIRDTDDPWVTFAHTLGCIYGLAAPAGVIVVLAGSSAESHAIGVALIICGVIFGLSLNLIGLALKWAGR